LDERRRLQPAAGGGAQAGFRQGQRAVLAWCFVQGQALNLETAVVNWYEDRLRGRHGAADSIPRLCLSLST
ncbi:hypothetical protein R0G64_32675, partial [Pseudomonas otitidis]